MKTQQEAIKEVQGWINLVNECFPDYDTDTNMSYVLDFFFTKCDNGYESTPKKEIEWNCEGFFSLGAGEQAERIMGVY